MIEPLVTFTLRALCVPFAALIAFGWTAFVHLIRRKEVRKMDEYPSMTVARYRDKEEACSELERELNVRARCFPRWIKEGRVNRIDAQDRLDRLATALQLLEGIKESSGAQAEKA